MSEETKTVTFEASNAEGVTVEDAEQAIESFDSIDELDAFVADELAGDNARKGVMAAYKKKADELLDNEDSEVDAKEEDEPVEMVSVSRKELEVAAAKLAAKVEEDNEYRSDTANPDPVDAAFEEAVEAFSRLTKGKAKTVEVSKDDLVRHVAAVVYKNNQAQERRGIMQPSPAQKSLKEAADALLDLSFSA